MEVILDSSFIISCIKKKIDFLEDLAGMGFKVLLPKEVVEEIKDLRLDSALADRTAANVALELFAKRKILRMTLGDRQVDEGLIEFGKRGAYIATLDAVVKRSVPNRVVISEAGNNLIVERS